MKRLLAYTTMAALPMLMAPSAHALLIDGFGDDQAEISSNFTTGPVSSGALVITDTDLPAGATRTLEVEKTTGDANNNTIDMEVTGGKLHVNQAANTGGEATSLWSGFGTVDFTNGALLSLVISFLDQGLPAGIDVALTLFEGGGSETVSKHFANDSAAPMDVAYMFTGAGIDLSQIDQIELLVDGSASLGADVSFELLESITAVPEPLTLALFGIALVAQGVARRPRRPAV